MWLFVFKCSGRRSGHQEGAGLSRAAKPSFVIGSLSVAGSGSVSAAAAQEWELAFNVRE